MPAPTARHVLGRAAVAAAGLAVAIAAGLEFGGGAVHLHDAFTGSLAAYERAILFEVRLPRVLLAATLGGALALAGVTFQALLRNPLAEPYVLGVSGGAGIGGVLALAAGAGSATFVSDALVRFVATIAPDAWASLVPRDLEVKAVAFLGALGALVLIVKIATVNGRLATYTVLLTGAIFNAFSGAVIAFVQSIASLEELHDVVFWLMGRVDGGYPDLAVLATTTLAVSVASFAMARDFNVLTLGEEGAAQLGVDVDRVRRRSLVFGSLLTGLAVSIAGLVGFVGLIVPHVVRLVYGPDHRTLLPCALLWGGAFLVVADLLARTVVAPVEIPVGVVTALAGGPFFLVLLRRRRRLDGAE